MTEFLVATPADFNTVIEALIPVLLERSVRVIALSGDLGAGKTTFTQQLAKRLGVTDQVTSPTFVIMRSYATTDAHFKKLVHIDAYRFLEVREAEVLGMADVLKEEGTLAVIEWPEHIAALIPKEAIRMSIVSEANEVRRVTYDS